MDEINKLKMEIRGLKIALTFLLFVWAISTACILVYIKII